MRRSSSLALALCALLPFLTWAEAPVVDDSENFALLDDSQAAFERPVAREVRNQKYDDAPAFAHETTEVSTGDNQRQATNNVDLFNQLQSLKQEVQELRGQLEMQAHTLQTLQSQQLSFYKDLDTRLQQAPVMLGKKGPTLESPVEQNPLSSQSMPTSTVKKPLTPTVINHTSRGPMNPAEEQISYLAAYELLKNKRFDEALAAMQAFVGDHPQGGYAANAHYWIGELQLLKKNYPDAIQQFETVLSQFPASSKSAASMLKTGYALAASGQTEAAIQRLQQVIKTYPDTNTALLAETKLKTLST